ncbi:MAG: signal peptidase II [Fibrobacterota bacterium]
MRAKVIFLSVFAPVLVLLDQLTKQLVASRMVPGQSIPVLGDWVRLTFIYNQNGAFGLTPAALLPFLSSKIFFTVFNLAAMALVVGLYLKTEARERWMRLGLALIVSGAMGNLIDRLRLGHVIDFVDCDFPDIIMERFAIFNVADSCITVGIALLIFLTLRGKKNEPVPPADNRKC